MKPPEVEFHQDHLVVRLEGMQRVATMRRAVVVPYTTIENAGVTTPEWPSMTKSVFGGSFVPGVVARGSFFERGGRRRFLDIDRKTSNALTLKLAGHPEYDEVTLDIPQPGEVLEQVSRHRSIAPDLPPVYE